MNFNELEKIMRQKGVYTLAEIARFLNTTPQAVSNWKSRNQVPSHIAYKLNQTAKAGFKLESNRADLLKAQPITNPIISNDGSLSISDIILIIAEQLKVVVVITFISAFLTFTYTQFIKQPLYVSEASLLLPEPKVGNLGGIAGLANQFGVNIPSEVSADLSSPTLYPDLLKSRTFAKKILYKEFYLKKYGKNLPLILILHDGDEDLDINLDKNISEAILTLNKDYLSFSKDLKSPISKVQITAPEANFSKKLADIVLFELESLNRFFKSKTVREKTVFIESRIKSVEIDLKNSEQELKNFKQRNRQVTSPSLMLEEERIERDVEVQKGVYLTLKQQLELAKIEEIQESNIVQILDYPTIPYAPSNKNIITSTLLSIIFGITTGIFIGFLRSYIDSNDIEKRKKIRRTKHFFKKKIKDLFVDKRISGIFAITLGVGIPIFLGNKSSNPQFFGMYSKTALVVNIIYLIGFLMSLILYLKLKMKKSPTKHLSNE